MIFLKNCFANVTSDVDFVSIIHDVNYAIKDSEMTAGFVSVSVAGGGVAIAVFEPIPEVIEGLKTLFETLVEWEGQAVDKKKEKVYTAPRILSAMVGRNVTIPLKDAKLILDPYEEIFLIDFDKKVKRREYFVQIMGEGKEEPKAGRKK